MIIFTFYVSTRTVNVVMFINYLFRPLNARCDFILSEHRYKDNIVILEHVHKVCR